MRSALYYPHTSIENIGLIRTALLLWDHLEFIVPWRDFSTNHGGREIQRAMEIIGRPRVPTTAEKRETHELIEDLITGPLPPEFYYDEPRISDYEIYEIYPQKLLPETWQMLQETRFAGPFLENSDGPMTTPGGLIVMSLLADCCAGKTRTRVTDRGAAYATVTKSLATPGKEKMVRSRIPEQQLVPISVKIINADTIPIERLIYLREREAKESGHTLRDLRHRYLARLEGYVTRLTTEVGTASDAKEIRRQFRDDMKADLTDLEQELGFARRDALFSKEMLLTTLAGIGTIATLSSGVAIPILGALSLAGAPATLVGAAAVGNKYLSARRSVMQKHPMAYLYEATRI